MLFPSVFALAQESKLTITFKGLSSGEGFLMVRVLNEKGEELEKDRLQLSSSDDYVYDINLLPGYYAIQVYHDENGNGDLDKNAIGVPTEKYGFSNNARGLFGPPDLDDQLVEVKGDRRIFIDLQ